MAKLNFQLPVVRDRHYEIIAKMIERSFKKYRQDFGSDRFIVVFYPGCRDAERLKPYLKKMGVRFLDYSGLFPIEKPEYWLKDMTVPGHPSPLGTSVVANQLARDLETLLEDTKKDPE